MTDEDFIWQPQGKYLHCRVLDYMHEQGVADWQTLIERSCKDSEWFWETSLEYMGFQWTKKYSRLKDESKGFPWTQWFIDGQFNAAYNCLDWHMEAGKRAGARVSVGKDHPALIWQSEAGENRKLTYGELDQLSGRVAALLAKLGLNVGDAVGIYMPMVPETVAVFFGCLKFGAVAVPIFSGFGSQALATRLEDAQAKVIFTADSIRRRGRSIEIKSQVDAACASLPKLGHVVVFKHGDISIPWMRERDLWFHEAVNQCPPAKPNAQLSAEHHSMYLYTSGTTGKPKGTVHTHAGALAQIAKELGFNYDVQAQDTFFWLTDIGWMMGPWAMLGVTFWGGTLAIFEGAPDYPDAGSLWRLVERLKVTILGISPTAIRMLKGHGDSWIDQYDLKNLRILGSTGEPWDRDSYMWYFEKAGAKRCPIINISGGTEVVGGLLLPLPVMPLKACSLGGQGLAMDVDVFNEAGEPVRDEIGYLVCKKPSPSMTKGFLNDSERYLNTYFNKFSGVWYHGDWAKVDNDGSWFLFGRADDTIKVGGKRVGPAEIESVLIEHENVAEAAVIGVPDNIKGEALIYFVVLKPSLLFDNALASELKEAVVSKLGAIFKPEIIYAVPALPKTRSGKIVRQSIRKQYLGQALGDTGSIENPEAFDHIPQAGGSNNFQGSNS